MGLGGDKVCVWGRTKVCGWGGDKVGGGVIEEIRVLYVGVWV